MKRSKPDFHSENKDWQGKEKKVDPKPGAGKKKKKKKMRRNSLGGTRGLMMRIKT